MDLFALLTRDLIHASIGSQTRFNVQHLKQILQVCYELIYGDDVLLSYILARETLQHTFR